MTSAAEFDAELVYLPWQEIHQRWPQDQGQGTARRALASLASCIPAQVEEALLELSHATGPLASGVRLLCFAALQQFEQIQLEQRPPVQVDAEAVEGSMYAMIALSVAAAEKGQPDRAAAHLFTAQHLAWMLGLRHRQQWIALEMQRQLLALGLASPDAIDEALALAPAQPGRLAWAREIQGGALLARGRYSEAALTSTDGVRLFTLAMLGITQLAEADESYGSLTLALSALREGATLDGWAVRGQPEQTYLCLLAACAALQNGVMPQLPLPPSPPDQQLMWALLSWEAMVRGDTRQMPGQILDVLTRCLPLVSASEIMTVLRPFAPIAVAALAACPLSPDAVAPVPVLIGECLLWQGERIKLPGRLGGGPVLLMQALGQNWSMSRVERLRLRKALTALNLPVAPVLLTDLLRALAVLCPAGGSSWRSAFTAVTSLSDTRAVSRELSEQYAHLLETHA